MFSDSVFTAFQQKINYTFQNIVLLKTALTHKSYFVQKERDPEILEHNERLEFLGDAVLELVTTEYLFLNYSEPEGFLTAVRSSLVNYKNLGKVGKNLEMEKIILLSNAEKEELGEARLTIVADAVEALIGSMYLDGGYDPCKDFIRDKVLIFTQEIVTKKSYKDNKTKLQEIVQKEHKVTPKYSIISSEGLDHNKVFRAGVIIGESIVATGEGKSKQEAEVEAAGNALQEMEVA